MRKWALTVFIMSVGVLAASAIVVAQDDEAMQRLGSAFEATVAAHYGQAKIDTTIVNRGRNHQKRWQLGGSELVVYYSVEASGRAAAEVMRYKKLVIQTGVQPLDGFGDEAYWLPHSDPAGGSVLYSRRGRVVLEVYAPAPDEQVKTITRLFLAQVEKELGGSADR